VDKQRPSVSALRLAIAAFGAVVTLTASGPTARAAPAAAGPAFQTIAPDAILMDADNGTVLFEKNADDLVAPASTAKIMTAEIVFKQLADGLLKLDDRFVVSENAWRHGGAPSGGSAMFAAVNSRVRIEDLLRGLIIDSGNDAAIALAEGIAGTEDAFAAMMTARARELGLPKSTFTNAWGRGDPGQKVTAREMARLAIHVIATYPQLYRYFGEKEFTWNKVRQTNRNPLLTMDIGADGLKTGEIAESGYGLVGSAVQNGERLVVVLNGMKTARDRSSEAVKLLSWGFRAFDHKTLFAAGDVVGTAAVYGGASSRVPLVAAGAVSLLVPRGSAEPLAGRIVYDGPLPAPVAAGTVVASLKLSRGGRDILDVPLKTADSVAVGPLPRRALDAGWELVAAFMQTHVFAGHAPPPRTAQADVANR
jgi:D-alanyl-D-alanine carboxypeptidase (penicillin-binding protein 5/6)